ncbi:hypothetical protein HZS_998 [Henneguya salminicola]|nr:hypothetical protein HZS_998 [Henneguya salminicola]
MGCYLPLKQELYIKLKKLIPNENKNFNLLKYNELITNAPIKEIDQAIEFIKSKIDPDNNARRVLEIFCQNMDWMLWGQTKEYL